MVDIATMLTRGIRLNIPLASAAMDTVTEAPLRSPWQGRGHRDHTQEHARRAQAVEVDKVKKSESGMIVDPITMRPEQTIGEALKLMMHYRISGVPITVEGSSSGSSPTGTSGSRRT
jgi:IMP dehydrogenase